MPDSRSADHGRSRHSGETNSARREKGYPVAEERSGPIRGGRHRRPRSFRPPQISTDRQRHESDRPKGLCKMVAETSHSRSRSLRNFAQ